MKTRSKRILVRHVAIALLVCAIIGAITTTEAVMTQSSGYYYTDKLFGTHFTFKPKADEVMVKFAPKPKGLQKDAAQAVIEQLDLDTIHDAVETHRFGVYKIPAGGSLETVMSQLQRETSVQAVFSAMIDQDGYTRYFIPDEFTVQFRETLSKSEMIRIIESYGCEIVKEQWTYGYYALSVPPGEDLFEIVRTFMELPQVKFSELSFIGFDYLDYIPNDIWYSGQWALNNNGTTGGTVDADIDAPEAWDIERGDPNVLIVIIDKGVDWDHVDLRNNLAQNLWEDADGDGHTIERIGGRWVLDPGDLNGVDDDGNGKEDDLIGWDFCDDDNNPMPQPLAGIIDLSYAHGTCCAGLAAAVTDNIAGVAGVAHNCRFMPIRFDYTFEAGMDRNNADAINYAASFISRYDGVVVSCSWHTSGGVIAIHDAIRDARTDGVVVCFSSGNDNATPINYPARYVECISVGATSECDERKSPTSCDGEVSWGSNFGDELDIAAPGVHLPTTDIDGPDGYVMASYFDNFGGTSGATPLVAGAAALLLSYDHTLLPDEVQEILQSSAEKVGGYDYNHDPARPGHSVELGYGRLNVNRALQMLMARTGAVAELLPAPADLVLSMDRSGSMTAPKLSAAINAASQVIRLMNIGDEIGVTIYDDIAEPLFPAAGGVAEITSEDVKDDAIDAIRTITARNRTSIGGGLSFAQAQIEMVTTPNYPQSIILMSDGLSNEPPWIRHTVPLIPTATDVYTIGFGTAGEDVDEDSLAWIASGTGGLYFFAGADGLLHHSSRKENLVTSSTGGMELIKAYQASLNLSSNRQMVNLYSKPFQQTFQDSLYVDASIYEIRFSLLWEDLQGNYSLILYSPSGKKIEPSTAATDPLIDYIEDATVLSYSVRQPETGPWLLVGTGQGSKYFISASGYSHLKSLLSIESWGTQLPILLKLRLIEMGLPVNGAEVTATVGLPSDEYAQLQLYDDGKHRDGLADDGLYANFYDNTGKEGSYSVEIFATGYTPSKNEAFTRYNVASTYLKEDSDLQAVKVALPNIVARSGHLEKIPIYVNTDVYVRGIEEYFAKVAYDSLVLSPTGDVELTGTLSGEDWNVKLEMPTTNEIEVRGDGPALDGCGILVNILFEVLGEIGETSELDFSDFMFTGDEGSIDVITTNGSLTVGETFIGTGVEEQPGERHVPDEFALLQNYPNPFNPVTHIQYQLSENSPVVLSIYNMLGQEVIRLVDEKQLAGYYTVRWNGVDTYGRTVASGIYLLRLQTYRYVNVKKMFLLR